MSPPLSISNLISSGWRTVLSIVGISIAILLIFMQLGFLGAVTDTAVVFYDQMDFDLVARSPDYYNFVDSAKFSREDIAKIESIDGVASVQPIHVSLGKWNYAEKDVQRGMLIMGVDPRSRTFVDPDLVGQLPLLNQPSAMLVDRTSKPKFLGPDNSRPFDESDIDLKIELNGVASRIAGLFGIGTGLAADGSCVINEEHFQRVMPGYSANDVGLGLIQLKRGTNIESARQRIQSAFPKRELPSGFRHSVEILTRQQVASMENRYWLQDTPVGFIFFTGAVVAFVVGAIIVYIVLSSDITRQIGEYATLKAMGYRDRFLSRTVLEQAFVLAVISFVLALAVSLVLYQIVGSLANLPIRMTAARLAIVFGSSLVMSFLSAMIAMQKLRQADPADLF